MRPSFKKTYAAVKAHWDTYSTSPTRQWIMEYTGLSRASVQMAIQHLKSKNLVYAPRHSSYIGLVATSTSKPREPWDQEPVRV